MKNLAYRLFFGFLEPVIEIASGLYGVFAAEELLRSLAPGVVSDGGANYQAALFMTQEFGMMLAIFGLVHLAFVLPWEYKTISRLQVMLFVGDFIHGYVTLSYLFSEFGAWTPASMVNLFTIFFYPTFRAFFMCRLMVENHDAGDAAADSEPESA